MKLRIIAVLAAAFFAAAFFDIAPKSSALTQNIIENCGEICSVYYGDNERFYIIGKYDGRYIVTTADSSGGVSQKNIDVNAELSPYAYFNDVFYFFSNGVDTAGSTPMPYVTVTSHDCKNGVILTRTINDAEPVQRGRFAFDGKFYYLAEPAFVNIYNDKFKYIDSVSLQDQFISMDTARDGSAVYCVCSNTVVMITNTKIYDINIKTNDIYINDDKFSDNNSVVYSITGESILYDEFETSRGVGEIGGWLIGVRNNMVSAVNGDSIVPLFGASNDMFICGSGCCICVIQKGNDAAINYIFPEDITNKLEVRHTESNVQSEGEDNNYVFDEAACTVSNIEVGTTAAEVKRSTGGRVIDKSGGDASGAVATGMRLVLSNNTYTIIIPGDVNGTGTVNSADMDKICDHICGESNLNGIYLKAADLNEDNIINLKDAYLLNAMLM